MKKIYLFILGIFLISLVSASLGTFKINECVDIKTILNATSVNISTLNYPNSSLIISNKPMTKNGLTFNYTFCNTSVIGKYNYDYYDNLGNVYVNDFSVTSTGVNGTMFLIIFLFVLSFAFLVISMFGNTEFFLFISGCLFLVSGIFLMIFGIDTINDLYTRSISFVSLGLGLLLTLGSYLDSNESEDEYDYYND